MHPAILVFLQLTIEIITLGFTSPASIFRFAALPLQFTFWYLIHHNLNNYMRANWSQIFTAACFSIFVMNFTEMALLRKWSFEAQGPNTHPPSAQALPQSNGKAYSNGKPKNNSKAPKSTSPKVQDTMLNRLKFGRNSTFSIRDINTPHQLSNIPPFSSSSPSYTPSRTKFLLKTLEIGRASCRERVSIDV